MSSPSEVADTLDMAEYPGNYMSTIETDINKNESEDKKVKPHAQVHLLSATENCKICGERAARHVHYGATTCFSCRAFFRRSLQKNTAAKYVCRRQSNCEINCKTRKNCQYCRYMKCLTIGMNPNYVLSEEERNKRFRKKNNSGNNDIDDSNEDVHNINGNIATQVNSGNVFPPNQETEDIKYIPGATNKNIFIKPENNFDDPIASGSSNNKQSIHLSDALSPSSCQNFDIAPTPTSVITSTHPPQNLDFPNRTNSIIVKNENMFENQPLPSLINDPSHWTGNNDINFSTPQLSSGSSMMSNTTDVDSVLDQNLLYNAFDDIVTADFEDSTANADLEELKQRLMDGLNTEENSMLPQDPSSEITKIVKDHDHVFYSVNFGEVLIKEMLMCSLFGVQMSTSAALQCYKLQVEKVTRIASSLNVFTSLHKQDQNALLKENADLIVSLWGAMFFDKRKRGMEQIMSSMGLEDRELIQNVFSSLMDQNNLNHIEYTAFNTIQEEADIQVEDHHKHLQKSVSDTIDDKVTSVLMTYIILFSSDFVQLENKKIVEKIQFHYLKLMEHHICTTETSHGQQPQTKLANVLNAVTNLREMADIKKSRIVNSSAYKHYTKETGVTF